MFLLPFAPILISEPDFKKGGQQAGKRYIVSLFFTNRVSGIMIVLIRAKIKVFFYNLAISVVER